MILNKNTKVSSFFIHYFFSILKAIIKLKKLNNKVSLKSVFFRKKVEFVIDPKNNEIDEVLFYYNKEDHMFKLNKDGTLKEYYKYIDDNANDFVYYRGHKYVYMESSLNSDNKETDRYYINDNAACGEIKINLINNSKTIHVICLNVKKNMNINKNIYKEIKYFDISTYGDLVYRKSTLTIRK